MQAGFPGADARPPAAGARVSALVILSMLVVAGCRDTATVVEPATTPGPSGLAFSVGDSLRFDAWALDVYGFRIVSTQTSILWRVTGIADSYAGANDVTTILERRGGDAPAASTDTLRFRLVSNGDIYQFGFIAGVIKRREGRALVPVWNRIAAFSLPGESTWIVGATDSAGKDLVQGRILSDKAYFTAAVNGVETLFRVYSVTMAGNNFQWGMSVSDVPPAIAYVREESSPAAQGSIRSLIAVWLHAAP